MRAKYIGYIGTRAHGRHVTSLLCQSDVIITYRISAYSGTSGSLFFRIKCGIQHGGNTNFAFFASDRDGTA